MKSCTYFCD